ncbi:MAG TPA: DUF2059 domain-containing protein [Candidatus Angelobacter sp.]
MKRVSILVFTGVLISLPLLAQQRADSTATQPQAQAAPLPADAPSREEVLQLFDLLQIKKLTETMMQAARAQVTSMAEQTLREEMPNPTPEQQRDFDDVLKGVTDDVLSGFPLDEMLDVMVPVYQRHLSKSDLQAIVAFYSSAVGQKLLHEQPQMVQESMAAMAPIQQRMMEEMMRKIKERVERSLTPKPQEKQKGSKS